jgi:Kef-type K+ transport system membrane component KefB
VFRGLGRVVASTGTLVVAGFALMLAFAELADAAKLAFIIGAFMAGLGLGRTEHHEKIADELGALSNVLVPVFFVSIGLDADLEAMAKPSVLGLAAVMTVIAVVGKVAAGWAVRGRRADRLLIGIGMIPRGEVGLIFASIGLANAVLDEEQYGALLIVDPALDRDDPTAAALAARPHPGRTRRHRGRPDTRGRLGPRGRRS